MKQQHHKDREALCVKRNLSLKRLVTHYGLRITQHGFTITELMIAVVIGMIVIGATYSTYIVQQRSFTGQDQVAELNSTSKIALNIITNDMREAGFGVRGAAAFNVNGFTTAITATDSNAAPDQITLVGGFRRAGTLCSNGAGTNISPTDNVLILVPPAGSTQLDNINTTDQRNISIGGLSFGVVIAGGGATTTITLQNPIGSSYPMFTDLDGNGNCDDGEGVPVFVVEDYTYQVVGTDLHRVRRINGGTPDTDVIAENIEDLQIAYGADTNGDNTIDIFRNTPLATDTILSVRLNILARTARADMNFEGQGNPPATIENRNLAATNDNFRRRWWQMEVDLRNPINLI